MLVGYEIKKLLSHKIIWAVLIICIVANAAITILTTKYSGDVYTAASYKALWYMISDLDGDDAESFLLMREKQLELSIEHWQERQLTKDVLQEVEAANGYNDYVDEVIEDANSRLVVLDFFSESDFAKRNLEATVEAYEEVDNKQVAAQPTKGIILLLQSNIADYLMIAAIMIICAFLVIYEKRTKEAVLFAASANGQNGTNKAKFHTLLSASFVLYFILFVEKIIIAGSVYGLGSLDGYIQSVTPYRGCLYDLKVWQFIVIVFILKLVFFMMLSSIIFAIFLRQKSGGKIIALIGIIGVAEVALYRLVPANSVFSPLKYINIISLMKTDEVVGKYINVNAFGYPLGFIWLSIIIYVIVSDATYLLFIQKWSTSCITYNKHNRTRRVRAKVFKRGLFSYDFLRLRRKSHIFALIALALVLQFVRFETYSYDAEPDKIYYRTYMQYLSSLPREEQLSYVNEENARYDSILRENVTDENMAERSNELLPYAAWQSVVDEYENIKLMQQSGEDVQLVFPDGFEQIMGSDSQLYVTSYAILIFLIILIFAGIYAIDYEENMTQFLDVSYLGRTRIAVNRTIESLIIAMVCFGVVYIPEFIIVWSKVGLSNFDVTAKSLLFVTIFGNLKIWQYMILFYFVRFLGMCLLIAAISYLSYKLKNTFAVIGISALVLILPIIFSFMRWMPVVNANFFIIYS